MHELFQEQIPGVTTVAQPGNGVWMTDSITGESAQIGRFVPELLGPENRMVICENGFLDFGVSALRRCMEYPQEWVTIDEIGYLDADCEVYQRTLWELMMRKRVAAVVRKQELPFLRELTEREDAFVVDMDDTFGNCGCVIMASGLGKRFGRNKLMADFDGAPMIARILDATQGIFNRRVVVTRHEDVADYCRDKGVQVVLHGLPHRSDTIRLGLEAMTEVDRCMFCPGDQPLLTRDTVAALCLSAAHDHGRIWRAEHGGDPGMPVLFPKWTFSELLALPEGKGGGWVIGRYPNRVGEISVLDPRELIDADTPEILEQLRCEVIK